MVSVNIKTDLTCPESSRLSQSELWHCQIFFALKSVSNKCMWYSFLKASGLQPWQNWDGLGHGRGLWPNLWYSCIFKGSPPITSPLLPSLVSLMLMVNSWTPEELSVNQLLHIVLPLSWSWWLTPCANKQPEWQAWGESFFFCLPTLHQTVVTLFHLCCWRCFVLSVILNVSLY